MRLGYENTDKKIEIEIYGLVFEIKNVDKIKEFENVENDDLDGLKKMIESLIGEGSIDKLNEQRKKDGYKEIDSTVAFNLLAGISQVYVDAYTKNLIQPFENSIDRIDNFNRVNNFNRETKRYNSRKRGRYGKY